MKPCVSQVTTLSSGFDIDVRAYGRANGAALEVWLTKLDQFIGEHSLDAVQRLVDESGVTLAAAAGQGGLLLAQGEARREAFALLERRLGICAALRIPTLVIAGDLTSPLDATDYERAVESLEQAGQLGATRGVRIALEFQSQAAFCNNLHTAASLVQHSGHPNVGICLDAFHYYTGPSKFEDLVALPIDQLFHVQLCDLAGTPRELAGDSDRVLPGDGDFQLLPIIDHLRTMGYAGFISVELMNPQIWQLDADQVVEVAIRSVRNLLGLSQDPLRN